MKIVHFSWEFFPIIRGGLGTFITELSKMQVKMGNEVTVFAMNERNSFLTLDNWKGVEVHNHGVLILNFLQMLSATMYSPLQNLYIYW